MKTGKRHLKFFQYVGDTPIVPTKLKIIIFFVAMLLLSTFSTNLVAIMLSQRKTIQLSNIVLVDKLTELYNVANSQKQIEAYSQDTANSIDSIIQSARHGFSKDEKNSVALGVNPDGSLLFFATPNEKLSWSRFTDKECIEMMENAEMHEGSVSFISPDGDEYFGVYKYHPDWLTYIVRANRRSDTNLAMYQVLWITIILVLIMSAFFILMGTKILDGLLSNINNFSSQLYKMQQDKKLNLIDLSGAPNDDITYLAANFNSLSSTITNLLQIFQKFVPENVVRKAHEEQFIRLEGSQRELTILFSDIKSFTYRTEVLGNDIIGVLNVHYDSVIRKVSENNGIIGSIIGDAILASYGIEEHVSGNKSFDAIKTAWEITAVTSDLRKKMSERRNVLEKERPLTENEERVYQAVMLDVGVGIDGGNVFYGNIGSSKRMANTVIGDNVNSASRLEGLTRIYKVPVIVSEYIKNEVLQDSEVSSRYKFYEIDTVQVKGKTEGVKVYFPLDTRCPLEEWNFDECSGRFEIFELGLNAYYSGDWKTARAEFKKSGLEVAKVFLERIGMKSSPDNWSGIWTMTTK
ncbi:adenylate/guanylate cyclase domain-containing protein [Treponema sp.]|uniref:adenylate/guanylate cyclase domain-containing protein n=1 Tax=Treponema sp. TaxID=166 RepID=UPI003F09197B